MYQSIMKNIINVIYMVSHNGYRVIDCFKGINNRKCCLVFAHPMQKIL